MTMIAWMYIKCTTTLIGGVQIIGNFIKDETLMIITKITKNSSAHFCIILRIDFNTELFNAELSNKIMSLQNYAVPNHRHNMFTKEVDICVWCCAKCLICALVTAWMFMSVRKSNIKHEKSPQTFMALAQIVLWLTTKMYLLFWKLNQNFRFKKLGLLISNSF